MPHRTQWLLTLLALAGAACTPPRSNASGLDGSWTQHIRTLPNTPLSEAAIREALELPAPGTVTQVLEFNDGTLITWSGDQGQMCRYRIANPAERPLRVIMFDSQVHRYRQVGPYWVMQTNIPTAWLILAPLPPTGN